MKLEDALHEIKKCQQHKLQDYSVLQVISDEEFYYPSPVSLVSLGEEGVANKFILFSAPGAVGKTALAKHISHKYGAFYWNVALKPVGGTSFAGEIAHAVGIGNGALQDKIYSSLRTGEILFVLDSFDEASLISRREGIKDFLEEIGKILDQPASPSVIITARTEMAKFIVESCKELHFGVKHYSVDYFSEDDAQLFIKSYFEYNEKQLSYEQKEEIRCYIEEIKQHIGNEAEIQSFIGYAQVLSILCRQIDKTFFESKEKRRLRLTETTGNDRLIYTIIKELIEREQSKLLTFKDSIRDKYLEMGKAEVVESLYCKQEQLIRLYFYTYANKNIVIDDFSPCKELLPEDQNTYLDLLKDWLPQHVFLQNDKIMPVFDDYLLAESLLNPDLEMFVEEYRQGNTSCYKLPTRVFMDCYLSLNQGKVKCDHIYLLELAYSSQTTINKSTYCEIGYSDSDDEETLYLSFSDLDNANKTKISMEIARDKEDPIRLNRANNISINVDGTIILSSEFVKDVVISQAVIECDRLEFDASEILLETYGNEENRIIVHEMVTKRPDCKLNIKGTTKLKIDFPFEQNSQLKRTFFELYPYQYSFDNQLGKEAKGIECFIYGLKKVLEQFKVDNYEGDPAKYKEKIDNRCHTGIKLKVLEFLKKEELVYEAGNMYKCSLRRMDELQISRVAYTQFKHEQLKYVYNKYLEWCNSQ